MKEACILIHTGAFKVEEAGELTAKLTATFVMTVRDCSRSRQRRAPARRTHLA